MTTRLKKAVFTAVFPFIVIFSSCVSKNDVGEGIWAQTVGGVQEARITVKGSYNPDAIVVDKGKPVRLIFDRLESSPCNETVVFGGDVGKSVKLPEGGTAAIEFTPEKSGEIGFQCGMGMIHGKVIVR